MSNLVVPDARMNIHALLNSDNVYCHEKVSIGNMADSILHALGEDENSISHEESNLDTVASDSLPIEEEQLSALRTTIAVVEAQDAPPILAVRYFRQMRQMMASAKV